MKKIFVLFVLSIVLAGCKNNYRISYDEIENCTDDIVTYSLNESKKIHIFCADNFKIKENNKYVELEQYIKNNDMEQLVDELVVSMNLKEILRDGGTKVYVDDENKISSNGLTIVICNRINSDNTVEDIYIGGTQLNNYDYCQEIK